MKKLIIITLALALTININAQLDKNRTIETIVADALMALPAQNEEEANRVMEELAAHKGDAVKELGTMLKSVNNVSVNYAFSGLAGYVSTPGREGDRKEFAKNVLIELDKNPDIRVKKFYLQLLTICGKDDVVPALKNQLSNKDIQEAVVETLVSIGSDEAKKALLSDLSIYGKGLAAHIVGMINAPGYEKDLMSWYQDATDDEKMSINYALGQTGGKKSLKFLSKTDPCDSYLDLLKRMSKTEPKLVIKEAKKLYKNSRNQAQLMVAAVNVLMQTDLNKAKPYILEGVADSDSVLSGGIFNLVRFYNDPALSLDLAKLIEKSGDNTKVDIINFLGDNHVKGSYKYVEPYIIDENPQVAMASIFAAARIEPGEDIIKKLCSIMAESSDKDRISAAAYALSYTKYEEEDDVEKLADELCEVITCANPTAQNLAIELLAKRKFVEKFSTVASKVEDSNTAVAAYKALKDLASKKDLDGLLELLMRAEDKNKVYVQDAIYMALEPLEQEDRKSEIQTLIAKSGAKKNLLYPVLTRVGDYSTLRAIVNDFPSASKEDKDLSIHALRNWNGSPAFKEVAQIIDKAEPEYKTKLWGVYVDLVAKQKLSPIDKSRYAVDVLTNTNSKEQIIKALKILNGTKTYLGMVEAAKFMDNKDPKIKETACQTVMNTALNNKDFTGETVVEILEKCSQELNNPDAGYQRESIKKHIGELDNLEPVALSDDEINEGFELLFDGSSLDKWQGNKYNYIVEGRNIVMYPGGKPDCKDLYTEKEYDNFILRFEFWLSPGANNGLGIRTPMNVDAAYHGMELQIIDNEASIYARLKEYQYHGSIYGIHPAKRGYLKKQGQWNTQEVIADGNHIKVTLNGVVILDVDIAKATKNFTTTMDKRDHPGMDNKSGYIGFLGHGSHVKFRNIRIKEL